MGPAEQRLRQLAIQNNHRYVPHRGNTAAPVCIIGEAPGAEEETQGIPFIGASGNLLTKMMGEAGFDSHDYWVTNAYKIRPPDNELSRLAELGIPKEAFEEQLLEELHAQKPSIIICCGATPTSILCQDTIDRKAGTAIIGKWRGSLLQSPKLNWPHYIIPTIHPAFILREWSERPIGVFILAKAKEEVDYLLKNGQLQPLPVRELLTQPSAIDTIDYLREAYEKKEQVSNDIETIYGKYPYTISVARSPTSAISFSFWDYHGSDGVAIWRWLDRILNENRTIGQNYVGFDCHMLDTLGFSPNVDNVDDTLVRHHVLWPEFEHKLQFLGMQYTRQPFWKDEGKYWTPKEGKSQLMRYNALDTACTYEVYNEQEKDFDDRPYLREFYKNYEMRLDRALFHVENRGILVDIARINRLRDHILRQIDKHCDEAESIVGRATAALTECKRCPKKVCKCGIRSVKKVALERGIKQVDVFNIASSKQLIEEFELRGIKVPKKRGKPGKAGVGNKTVDEEALLRIALSNNTIKLPEIVIKIRELNKIRSTNVDAKLYENTLFCSYGTTGTDTGRRNSSENIFGFGGNMQNIPKHTELGLKYRECLVSRPGFVFVEADQKGAEDWLVQGIIVDNGGLSTGLDELKRGINRHKKLAAFLFAKPENEVDKAGIHYYAGKKTRHAGNYDMQADKMSVVILVETGMNFPPAYTQWMLNKFHEFDPGIRGIFHKYVQDQLSTTRTLKTPLGRERVFFGCRPASNNADTFRKGYAYIPQSTVGDNTGMAIVYLHQHDYRVIADNHDAVTLEVKDDPDSILDALNALKQSFVRPLRFPNGTVVEIPVETMIGYNQREMITCPDLLDTTAGLKPILQQLQDTQAAQTITING